jgi:hypothetical protein
MTIDKQKLQKLLWAEAASFRSDCAEWKRNTEALQDFLGEKTVEEVALELLAENEALRKEREGKVLIPLTPSAGLLMSMAIRSNHALGCPGYYDQKGLGRPNNGVSHARMLECALGNMRKLHEEVVGAGFYSVDKEADYLAMAQEVQP